MKKIVALLTLMGMYGLHAQFVGEQDIRDIQSPYIEVSVTDRLLSDKVNVDIDFGQETKYFTFKNEVSIKDGNKRVKFNSKISVLNFFLKFGYELHTVAIMPVQLGSGNLRMDKNSNGGFITKYFLVNKNLKP
ncbi:MAG: hypothetical protein ACON47_01585 [Flavobacteriaceae bacterium]